MPAPCDHALARAGRDALHRRCPGVPVAAIWLFGSVAAGRAGRESDIDLGVLADRPLDTVALFDAAQDIAVAMGRDIDLVDLRRAGDVLASQVIAHGRRILVEDETAADRWAAETLADYAWFGPQRQAAIEALLAPYRAGGALRAGPGQGRAGEGVGHGR